MLLKAVLAVGFLNFQYKIFILAWPTLQVTVLNYTYQVLASNYIEYSMVPAKNSAGHDIHINLRRDNMNMILKAAIYFETVEFMNKTIDVCKVLNANRYEPLIKLMYKVLTNNPESRLPKKCPIKKGKYYNFLLIETDMMPPVWPEKRVNFHVELFLKEVEHLVPLMSTLIHCQFNKKKTFSSPDSE